MAEMDLKDFVANVISQIVDGVTEAIRRHDERGAIGRINPIFPGDSWKDLVKNIDFDIAITAGDKIAGEGGGGVRVHFFEAKGKLSKSYETAMTNRIKFSIPVSLPAHRTDP